MPPRRKPPTKAELLLRSGMLLLGVAGLGTLAFLTSLGAWHMFQKEQGATTQADAAQQELALLVSQQEQVQSQLQELSTQTGTEAALRERYGVVKPGEGVIQIVEKQAATSTQDAASSRSFFGNIVHLLWPW